MGYFNEISRNYVRNVQNVGSSQAGRQTGHYKGQQLTPLDDSLLQDGVDDNVADDGISDIDDRIRTLQALAVETGDTSIYGDVDRLLTIRQAREHELRVRSTQSRPLSKRTVRTEAPRRPPLRPQLLDKVRRNSKDKGVRARQLAAKLLKDGKLPEVPPDRRGMMETYLALQYAEHFLHAEDDDQALMALLPLEGDDPPRTLEDLSKALVDADEDADKVFELLKSIGGLPTDKTALMETVRPHRHHPQSLGRLLRGAMALTDLREKAAPQKRQAIRDAQREIEGSKGSVIQATLNAQDAAAKQDDPETFIDAYSNIVHGEASFAKTFRELVERFPPEKLRNAVGSMKEALADDLAAATPSRDKIRLHAINTQMTHMHVATTLIEMVNTLFKDAKGVIDKTALQVGLAGVIAAGWASTAQFQALLKEVGVSPQATETRRGMAGIRKLVSLLPPQMYMDANGRTTIIDAAIAALDEAIDSEEELELDDLMPPLPNVRREGGRSAS